eukprot:gene3986-7940_t
MRLDLRLSLHRILSTHRTQWTDYAITNKLKITMVGYVKDVLESNNVKRYSATPASENLFVVSEVCVELSDKSHRIFYHKTIEKRDTIYCMVAKLFYLAKRVRPDLLTSIAYLSARIQTSKEDDWHKLELVLDGRTNPQILATDSCEIEQAEDRFEVFCRSRIDWSLRYGVVSYMDERFPVRIRKQHETSNNKFVAKHTCSALNPFLMLQLVLTIRSFTVSADIDSLRNLTTSGYLPLLAYQPW